MEKLILVAAIGKNNELGLDNHLIWRIKEDLDFYRKLTYHENVIMGRNTFEHMPQSALKERNIFVLSSKPLDKNYDVSSFNSIESLLEYIEIINKPFIVAGGAKVYESLMPYADVMYLTEIDDYASADTFFPEIEINEWNVETIYYDNDKDYINGNTPYVRNRYTRKRVK